VSLVNREATVTLARGTQRFHILASVNGPARIELRWAPPGSTSLVRIPRERLSREQRGGIGLLALYRSGLDPAAPTELAQVERYLQRDAYPPPLARPYVVDWLGVLDAPRSGTYRFKLDASGPASLWIDDHPILSGTAATGSPLSVVLGEGDHRVQVRLIDMEGPTRLDLAWAPPGDDMDPIPTSRFGTPNAAVNAILPFAVSADTAFVPLGTPKVRWLASTEGEPRAVAVGPNDDVFLTNIGAHQIQQVVGEGRSLVGLPAALSVPSDVEVGPDGAVWALDALQGDVVQLGPDGTVDRSLNTRDLGLYRPRGLAVAPDGSVLVADTGGSRIVRFAGDGTLLDTIGPDVGGPERIRQPTDVVVGPGGELFVVNGEAGALLRLTPQGRYERHWSVLPSDTEKGAHLAIGPDRSIWVSEPEGRRVRRFTWDGTPSGVVDQTDAGRLLRSPVGIAVGSDGTLYVADAALRAIVAFGFER
jgi:streptogramin lyase